MKTKQQKGFTLIELLVVIAIIGILSSVALVSLNPVRERGRDARRVSDIYQIATAMELCYNNTICGGSDSAYQAITVDGASYRLTSAGITGFLNPFPQDLGGGSDASCVSATGEMTAGAYCGYASTTAENYCIYAYLSDGSVFTASEKGSQYMSARPANREACP